MDHNDSKLLWDYQLRMRKLLGLYCSKGREYRQPAPTSCQTSITPKAALTVMCATEFTHALMKQ